MKTTFSIFPKFYKHLTSDQLAELVHEVKLDTTNLVIRDGYWVSMENLRRKVSDFLRIMQKHHLDVRFCTAGFVPRELFIDSSPLAVLADHGIREFRMDYFRIENGDVRKSLDNARATLMRLAELCQQHSIRGVYQLHHGNLISSPSCAYRVIEGLPPDWISIELDPGNQSFEGFENWNKAAGLLADYVTAAGIKDTMVTREMNRSHEPDKGWKRQWCPIYEGTVNWVEFLRALKLIAFRGTFVFMPFYDENNPVEMTKKLKQEVQYLRNLISQVENEIPQTKESPARGSSSH